MSAANADVNVSQADGGSGSAAAAAASASSAAAPVVVDDNEAALEEGDEVRAAITAYLPPDTYDVVPKPNRATSSVWKYGVKMVERSTKKVVFACFGSPGCRASSGKGVYVGITKSSVSNAVGHIRAKHAAVTPKKTLAAKAKTDRLDLRVLKATSSAMYTEDHPRFLAMSWVKGHVIEGSCPVSRRKGVGASVLEADRAEQLPRGCRQQRSREAQDRRDVRRDRFPVQGGNGCRGRRRGASAPEPRPVGGQILELEVHRDPVVLRGQ